MFHITPRENVDSILTNGLEPRIGQHSQEFGETIPGIYVFPTWQDAESAEWFVELWKDDDDLVVLEIDTSGLRTKSEVSWEVKILDHVESYRIKIRNDLKF